MALDLNHEFETDRAPAAHGLMARIAGFAVIVAVAFYFGVRAFSSDERIAETAQQVALLDELMPPPEPEPEPEMEEVTEEIVEEIVEEITPASEPPPPGEVLGLDAEGDAGGDQFGLAARKGGRDLLLANTEGTGGELHAAWRAYADRLTLALERLFNARDDLRKTIYDVTVRVWVDDDGGVTRAELLHSTGNRELDRMIEETLVKAAVPGPPADLPQSLRLRIRSLRSG